MKVVKGLLECIKGLLRLFGLVKAERYIIDKAERVETGV